MHKDKSILLILPYFGKWPVWFDAFMLSIEKNTTINRLIPTDCKIPDIYPNNIQFIKTSLIEINKSINEILKIDIKLTPKKFCDLKPAYGHIFEEYATNYDFWGFTDMDIIFGDIRKFITNDLLDNYEIISSRKNAISGHFTLFRNNVKMNALYKQVPLYKDLFQVDNMVCYDESHFFSYCKTISKSLKLYNSKILLNSEYGKDSYQEFVLNKCVWINGKVYCKNKEIMYLHFMNWKEKMLFSEIDFSNKVILFYISYKGIHLKKFPIFVQNYYNAKNYLFGFYFSRRIKKQKKVLKKFLKSIGIKTN